MTSAHAQTQTALFGSISLGSGWQILISLRSHAPSWELVPPLLVGLIGLVGALNTAVNDWHRRRQERARLDAELSQAALDAATRRRAMDGPSLN